MCYTNQNKKLVAGELKALQGIIDVCPLLGKGADTHVHLLAAGICRQAVVQ